MYPISKIDPKKAAVLTLTLLCISSIGLCLAQTSVKGGHTAPLNANERLQAKVTYSCQDLSIEVALKELAELAKVYIVKSPKVTGNVTIEVVDVPLEELLANILGAYDYTYIATENMVRVIPLSETVIIRETLITQIYKITYADVDDVALALKDFLSLNGKISFNKGTSHIIVTDTEDKIKAIDKFIEEIDKITPQVLVEVRIYDIRSDEAFEIESEWSIERNTPEVTTEREIINSTRTGAEGVYPSTVETHTEMVGHQDDDTVPLTGLYTDEEITETVNTTYPTGPYNVNNDTTTKTYETRRRKPVFGGSFDKKDGGTIHISLLNNAVDLDFALSMLHSTVEAKLLANPRVMVLDNETATFETVREVPYTERTTTGGDVITSIQFKPVGVQLNVTPHIARDGMIRLKVMPEFGVVVDINDEGAPTIETRRAETTTLISDGQTIVLGGLRKKELKKGVDKMPLFGDLPLIGGLFRAESETEETSELVVFITTRIITSPALSKTEQKQYNATNFPSPKISEDTWLKQNRQSQAKAAAKAKAKTKAKKADSGDYIRNWMEKAKTEYPEQ